MLPEEYYEQLYQELKILEFLIDKKLSSRKPFRNASPLSEEYQKVRKEQGKEFYQYCLAELNKLSESELINSCFIKGLIIFLTKDRNSKTIEAYIDIKTTKEIEVLGFPLNEIIESVGALSNSKTSKISEKQIFNVINYFSSFSKCMKASIEKIQGDNSFYEFLNQVSNGKTNSTTEFVCSLPRFSSVSAKS